MPLEHIAFALASDRARFSHFVEVDGRCTVIEPLSKITNARVGVVVPEGGWPTNEQLDTIETMAAQATELNPLVTIMFCAGTSPFELSLPAGVIATTAEVSPDA